MRFTTDSRTFAATLKTLKTSRGKVDKHMPDIYRAVAFETCGQYLRLSCNACAAACADSIPAITQDSGESAADLDSVLTALTGVRGPIELSADGGKLTITQGTNTLLTCATYLVSDVPVSPEYPDDPDTLTVDIADLRAALTQCAPVASTDISRPILRGVYLECQDALTVVATDSHRMAIRTIPAIPADHVRLVSAILPAEYAVALCKVLPKVGTCQITFGERIWFQADGKMWSYRVVDGTFPNYRRVIPNFGEPATVEVSADAMIAALDGLAPISKSNNGRVCVAGTSGGVELSTHNGTGAEATRQVPAQVGGEVLVYINGQYLRSLLLPLSGKPATISLYGGLKPLSIRPADSSVASVGILMPMEAR